MKEFTLISMVDFVIKEHENNPYKGEPIKSSTYLNERIYNYAKFLKQPLRLEMFVPCDDKGNVLDEPKKDDYIFEEHPELVGNPKEYDNYEFGLALEQYQKVKEKILFDGFELVEKEEVYDSIRGIWIDLESRAFQIEGSLGVGYGNMIDETVSDLIYLNLILTENAISQIFG